MDSQDCTVGTGAGTHEYAPVQASVIATDGAGLSSRGKEEPGSFPRKERVKAAPSFGDRS